MGGTTQEWQDYRVSALGSRTPSQPSSPPSSQPSSQPSSPPPPLSACSKVVRGAGGGRALSITQPSGPSSHTPTSHTPLPYSASHLPLPVCCCIPQLYVACPAQRALAVAHRWQCVNTPLNELLARTAGVGFQDGDWGVGVKETAWHGTVRTTNQHKDNGARLSSYLQPCKNQNGTTKNYPAEQNCR
jgi:hypothetical protein